MQARHFPFVLLTAAITLIGVGVDLDAQRRASGQPAAKQAIQVALKVGGQAFESSEPGSCTYAATASIYQLMSELWSVQQSADSRSLSMTFWRPKDGSGEMVNLSLRSGNMSHDVNTVRGGATTGSGTVTLQKVGGGGTFTVNAKTKAGCAITGTIKCDAFAPHTADGGR